VSARKVKTKRNSRAGLAVYKDDLRFAIIGVEITPSVQGSVVDVVVDLMSNAPLQRLARTDGAF
jgi:hypothetical protein